MALNENRLVWLDMEMTGLDPTKERIIEVAVVVTEPDLTVVAEGPVLVVHQPDSLLDGMDNWNKSTHGKRTIVKGRVHRIRGERGGVVVVQFDQRRHELFG